MCLLSPMNVLTHAAAPRSSRCPSGRRRHLRPCGVVRRCDLRPHGRAGCPFTCDLDDRIAALSKAKLCALARRDGLVALVDGAESMGVIDLNFDRMGCDFYACPGHKWLNGPPGTGIFYICDAARNPFKLWPTLSEDSLGASQDPISTQLQLRGCNNTPSYAAMVMAMDFETAIGKAAIERRLVDLSSLVKSNVVFNWGEGALFTPTDPRMSSASPPSCPPPTQPDGTNQTFINMVGCATEAVRHLGALNPLRQLGRPLATEQLRHSGLHEHLQRRRR